MIAFAASIDHIHLLLSPKWGETKFEEVNRLRIFAGDHRRILPRGHIRINFVALRLNHSCPESLLDLLDFGNSYVSSAHSSEYET